MLVTMSPEAIAVNRFGLGARPDEAPPDNPRKWLTNQFGQYDISPASWSNQTGSEEIVAELAQARKEMRNADDTEKESARHLLKRAIRDHYAAAVEARAEAALTTPAPFVERLVHFWANHFAVSIEKPVIAELAGAFELEAIRPHVLSNFTDLLFAAEQHPAMLLYLDQTKSIGPESRSASHMGKRDPEKKRGLNENLAREILELHTLGVRNGYTQSDVTEFSRALTGWSVMNGSEHGSGGTEQGINGFVFRPQIHEPGTRTIMGKTYSGQGRMQATAVLHDLAAAPATATHIATKLVRHFVSDTPPPYLVDKLSRTFIAGKGDLASLYQALVDAPEAWQPAPVKFKTPWEWLVSSARGLGHQNVNGIRVAQIMKQLGQPIWKPGSPAGYDDIADSWISPNALLRRVELSQRLVALLADRADARTLADKLLYGAVTRETRTAISHAESTVTSLALLLVSPEFLRR